MLCGFASNPQTFWRCVMPGLRPLFVSATLLLLSAPLAVALPAAPSLKPPVTFTSRVVSTQDAAVLRLALRAAESGDWNTLRRLRSGARDPVLSDLLLWRIALEDPEAGFDTLDQALGRLGDWPNRASILARAEAKISTSALSAGKRVAWLKAHGPITGDGRAALALALLQSGETEQALPVAREAWRSYALTPDVSRALLAAFRTGLTREDHRARADYLLWSGQYGGARELRPLVGSDWAALIEARIALAQRARNVDATVRAVPAALQSDPGLLYERARWRRKARLDEGIDTLLLDIDGAAIPEAGRGKLWDERHIALRGAIKAGDFDAAYRLATAHGLLSGTDFADAEFVAGWLALRRIDDAPRALGHFRRLEAGVSSPISAARAHYWIGRALETLGDSTPANAEFAAAAAFPFTFYGQLSGEKIGQSTISLPAPEPATQAMRDAFEARPLTRAARMLGEAGETALFRILVLHYDDQLETEADHELLFRLTEDYQMPHVGLRGAKSGLARGVIAADAAYPLLSYQPARATGVEDALVLALSRQESEFNPRAVSSANARGLMQLLPSTARRQAALEGLPFRTSWLTDDPAYNITLGSAHLEDLLRQFRGSYILTIASYNAGASRARQWIGDYGDPRRPIVDAVDWVETIPFSETRNYVQRVLENLQVYRYRLSGQPTPSQLGSDLRRGTPDD